MPPQIGIIIDGIDDFQRYDELLNVLGLVLKNRGGQQKPFLVSATQAADDIGEKSEDLQNSLLSAFAVKIQANDVCLNQEILRMQRELIKTEIDPEFALGDDVLDVIAKKASPNGLAQKAVILNLTRGASFAGIPIAVEDAEAFCQRTFGDQLSIDKIKLKVSEHFGIAVSDIEGERRLQSYVRPRHIAMYLAWKLTAQSLPQIGRRFGGRDHTTVLHAVGRVKELVADNSAVRSNVNDLRRYFKLEPLSKDFDPAADGRVHRAAPPVKQNTVCNALRQG